MEHNLDEMHKFLQQQACNFTNSSKDLELCSAGLEGLDLGGDYNILKVPVVTAFVIIIYLIVIVLGGLGNLLVVITIATTKRMQHATNIFIANLAIADIFVCIFDLPLNLYYVLADDWVYGKVMCHVLLATFGIVVYASTLSLTMIAVDRFRLIVTPDQPRMSVKTALAVVAIIGVISTIVALPLAVFANYVDFPVLNLRMRYCTESWPSKSSRKIYTLMTLMLQFVIPIVVIAVLYLLIFWKVRSARMTIKTVSKGRRKSKTNMMLVAVVSVFAICWIPYQLLSVICEFRRELVKGRYFKLTDVMLRVIAMSSSCVNPILYGWLNDNFRDAFLSIVQAKRNPEACAVIRGGITRGMDTLDIGQSELMLQPEQSHEKRSSDKNQPLVEITLVEKKYGAVETGEIIE